MAAKPHINKITRPISERVRQLQPSGIRRFFDLLATMEDTISLGVGEPDYATPWHIREAAIYSLEKGDTMYTSNSGMPELRREIADYLNKNYGLEYDPDSQILITVGVSEGLDLAARAIIDPGDEVIMADPSYVSYGPCVSLAGGKPVMVPTSHRDNFEVDPAAIDARVTDATKAVLIGYPANPTGAVMPRRKLEQLAVVASARNLLVISDEIYARVIYSTEHTCFAALPGMQERTIMGQKAALEALKGGDADIADMVEDYNRRRLVMVEGLNSIGLSCFEPKGAFYAFPSIESTGLSSEEFAEKLLIEEKVAVVPGEAFGEYGQGYVRCCYATQLSDIEEALARMKRFVDKHRG